jgi:hypothetical protein
MLIHVITALSLFLSPYSRVLGENFYIERNLQVVANLLHLFYRSQLGISLNPAVRLDMAT